MVGRSTDENHQVKSLAPKADGLDAFSFNGIVGEHSLQFLHGYKEPAL
jgi:hypothetical protein